MTNGLVAIIDDDRVSLEILEEVLSDTGIKCLVFDDPLVALKELTINLEVDAIVTDFRMPEMNGLELMTQLQQKNISIPVIMLTGALDQELAVKALNLGCHYLVRKPLSFQEFLHYTEQAIAYRRRELISERLLLECSELIKLHKHLSLAYETRYTQAENFVYQQKMGGQAKPDEIKTYLNSIYQGVSIGENVQNSSKLVESLAAEHLQLKEKMRRRIA